MIEATPDSRIEGPIRVVIADDHGLVRAGLRMILESEPDIQVVGEAADGREALVVALALQPDVVLADISMPPPDGIELARMLRRDLPAARIVIVSMHEDHSLLGSALKAGAVGYVTKGAVVGELIRAVRAVAAGQIYIDKALGEQPAG